MERQSEEKKRVNQPKNTSNTLLQELLEKREQYLKENPNMVPFQEEIDRLLDNAGSQENRMAVLGIMLEGKMAELHQHLENLSDMLKEGE